MKGKLSRGKHRIDRRRFLKLSGTSAALAAGVAGSGAGMTGLAASAAPVAAAIAGRLNRPADLPASPSPRVVIVGGGWSGLTMAKYVKRENTAFDVVLVEPRALFMSCPLSNLWLGGVIGVDMLLHSYLDAAKANGYIYFQASMVDLDRESRRVYTDRGFIGYDYLVLAPGIDYDYASLGVSDPAEQVALAQSYPAGFQPGSELLSLKAKLDAFEGGTFLLTVPTGNYRCYAGPYERACIIAAHIKRNGIKGKVVLLDPHEEPVIQAEGLLAAFEELYDGVLEYEATVKIEGVDLVKKQVITEFGEVAFTDAAIYPRIRAARLIETVGLADPSSPQKEAAVHPLRYHVKGDERVYVTGDARPMPFSKSANTANTEAHTVSRIIAAHALGRPAEWESPTTTCYAMVDPIKRESIMVTTRYKHDGKGAGWDFADSEAINDRSANLGKDNLAWGVGLYNDMFL